MMLPERLCFFIGDLPVSSEVWKPIPFWDAEVSSHGRVRSSKGLRKLQTEPDGYIKVRLAHNGNWQTFRVSRLVCVAFHGDPPFEGAQVRHKDHNRGNNREDNLHWGSAQDNVDDREKAGNTAKGERCALAKFTWDQVRELRQRVAAGERQKDVAQELGISQPNASAIVNNRTWVE